jgi:hypothetical protein
MEAAFDDYHMHPDEFLVCGDRMMATGVTSGTVPGTDARMQEKFWAVFTLKGGW